MKKTRKQLKSEQTTAEQEVGRLYNARNAAAAHTEDMAKKGIEVKTFFYDEQLNKRIAPANWRVKIGDEMLTMEEYSTVLMLLGYIK